MNFKLQALRNPWLLPSRIIRYYYRGVDFWPPNNFRRRYRFKFYLIDLPIRWLFKGVLPQKWDGQLFRTFFGEDIFIEKFFTRMGSDVVTFVDVGAGDGIDMSNTYKLALNGGRGLAIEGSPVRFAQLSLTYEKFRNVILHRAYVNSQSIASIIKSAGLPQDFDVLNLDIDSFDLHVLEAILKEFHPKLCVVEWNRSYPPDLYFTVKNDPKIRWDDRSAYFQGASLSAFDDMLTKMHYKIIAVQGAALFAIPVENPLGVGQSVSQLWSGYLSGPENWIENERINESNDVNSLLALTQEKLRNFEGNYELRALPSSESN